MGYVEGKNVKNEKRDTGNGIRGTGKGSGRECWKQVWADGRGVVYVRELATLKMLARTNGKWWCPVGKPQRCIAPKGARIW